MHATEKARSSFEASLLAYLDALRARVCTRCGGLLPMEQLIEALDEAQARREGRRPCSAPAAAHAGYCSCSMERLAGLAAEAAWELEQQRQRCDVALAGRDRP